MSGREVINFILKLPDGRTVEKDCYIMRKRIDTNEVMLYIIDTGEYGYFEEQIRENTPDKQPNEGKSSGKPTV